MNKRDLLEAAMAATADRGLNYGAPESNFQRIANLWNVHLRNRFAEGYGGDTTVMLPTLTPGDVAMMMVLLKLARLENKPDHLDSITDGAGYFACLAEIVTGGEAALVAPIEAESGQHSSGLYAGLRGQG